MLGAIPKNRRRPSTFESFTAWNVSGLSTGVEKAQTSIRSQATPDKYKRLKTVIIQTKAEHPNCSAEAGTSSTVKKKQEIDNLIETQ